MPMTLKAKLADPSLRLNAQLCVIPSATVTQAIAAAGADLVIIDQEHAPSGLETVHAMIAATQGTTCAPIVRIPSIDEIAVKKALDAGAEGICFPLLRSAADAARCVASLHYPPNGTRGWGPFIGHSRWGMSMQEYCAEAEKNLVALMTIETVEALACIEDICRVPGVDCVIVAPFDLSTELGVSGQFDHPDFLAAVARIETAANTAGIPLAGLALARPQAEALIAKGYRIIAGFDILLLKGAVAQSIDWTRGAG
jgi:4-hydroxy-2-oxoheptanedioate aldolase